MVGADWCSGVAGVVVAWVLLAYYGTGDDPTCGAD